MISQKLFNLFSSFSFDQQSLDQLWKKILRSRDPYATIAYDQITNESGYFKPECAPRLKEFVHDESLSLKGPYVPIQAFRWLDSSMQNDQLATKFLSSGTTASSRSHSFFSAEGLKFYRLTSCLNFFATLEAATGKDFDQYRGICLVPPPQHSPHSSLSKMLGWISEFVPVEFVTGPNLSSAIASKSQYFWIFGTSLQLFDLAEQYDQIQLPSDCLVFDTGGNKGRRVSLSEEQKLQKFSNLFGIKPHQLIREYGMCELASQAYAFWPKSQRNPSDKNAPKWPNYRFPWWAPVAVSKDIKSNSSEGRGALVIADWARVDLGLPIRTQDEVSLCSDGSFQIHGRLSGAVLKGCSIEFESDPTNQIATKTLSESTPQPSWQASIESLSHHFHQIISSQEFCRRLSIELESQKIATSAIHDLLADWPNTTQEWRQALNRSMPRRDGHAMPSDSKIMFVLPGNHSVAGIYPVILALLHQMRLNVRIPTDLNSIHSAIGYFLEETQKLVGDALKIFGPEFEISSPDSVRDFDAIFAVGSTQTVSQLQAVLASKPFQAMGSVHSIIFADMATVRQNLAAIVRDFLSLSQRGCLSARLLVIPQYRGDFSELEGPLDEAVMDFASAGLTSTALSQLRESSIEFLLKGAEVRTLEKSVNRLILMDKTNITSPRELAASIAGSMAQVSNCFCVMRVGVMTHNELKSALSVLPDQFRIGLEQQLFDGSHGQFVIGDANRQKWDGYFGQIRLFEFITHAKKTILG